MLETFQDGTSSEPAEKGQSESDRETCFLMCSKKRPDIGDLDWRRSKGLSDYIHIKFLAFPEGTWHIIMYL